MEFLGGLKHAHIRIRAPASDNSQNLHETQIGHMIQIYTNGVRGVGVHAVRAQGGIKFTV